MQSRIWVIAQLRDQMTNAVGRRFVIFRFANVVKLHSLRILNDMNIFRWKGDVAQLIVFA